ncbi:MAG: MYG1 family protein [Parachlamydiaceae bacterium]
MHTIPRSVGTHNGSFHADEVTACALLELFDLIDADKIHRSRDSSVLSKCEYVCDVGGIYDPSRKLFDHHQVDYEGNFSSAGMVLLYLKEIGKITTDEYDFLNNALIMGVDAHDNGTGVFLPGVCTYSQLISNFVPISHESLPETQDLAFMEAFYFAVGHLNRLWRRHKYVLSCKELVKQAMEPQGECLMFEHSIPWMENFFGLGGVEHPAKFIIMPSGNHWKLRGIPPTLKRNMEVRVPLPLQWAGLLDAELKEATQIPGAIFCHKGRFISVWETQEDAYKALELVLKLSGNTHDNL